MLYGFCATLLGQLLNDKSEEMSSDQLQNLLVEQKKRNSNKALQTANRAKPENVLPSLPENVTRVYTKQHKASGFEASYAGPFEIVEKISKSTIKIQVGLKANGEPIYELRHLNDVKLEHPNSLVAPAIRPRKGRPLKKPATNKENESSETTHAEPSAWSASENDLKNINAAISFKQNNELSPEEIVRQRMY